MLTELRIRNFAIIEQVNLPLAEGFNVLSGETGAGKSIIVGALGLLLGERASADLIRSGAERATVEGVFDATAHPDLERLVDERGIDVEGHLIVLRRESTAPARARREGVCAAPAHPDLARRVDERGIDVEGHLIVLRREITAAGRTRAWING